MKVSIEPSWNELLEEEFSKDYFNKITDFVKSEYKVKKVYPPGSQIFRAFQLTPVVETKVVILGQDPYHTPGVANGLAFSVNEGQKLPPSLRNIFKEIQSDLGINPGTNGDLSRWAKQGVLLLNATLTVEESKPGSHQSVGWEIFTDKVIEKISQVTSNLVFILWGSYARGKKALIHPNDHLILESPHPSPFSANRGFLGSKPFSKANRFLKSHNFNEIDWS